MKKILVVDDDPDIVEVVKMLLTRNGFEVHTHTTGYKVDEIVKQYKPNLVLLDINLPGKSGIDICRELKEISDYPPILLFSAHVKEGHTITTCKADGFVSKPFDIRKLIDIVNLHAN